MTPQVSAVVCTHNPREDHIERTLSGLRRQTFPDERWELIVVDNASDEQLSDSLDVSWHRNGRIVREDRVGLTHARLRGYEEATAPILVYVDDDNVLVDSYLRTVVDLFDEHPEVGAIGGKALPEYETSPPSWFDEVGINLGCRDRGNEVETASWDQVPEDERTYPGCAPIGAGLSLRTDAYAAYVESTRQNPKRAALDRRGDNLASGGDNDIAMSILEEGWSVGYFPSLELKHLIPEERLTPEYLAEMAESSNKTWVTVLDIHGIRPWEPIPEWTVPLRKLRAYFWTQAWRGVLQRIKWRRACGVFEGRALLTSD
jgi:glycosyltransferase involved in cell wall biosynthesis